MTPAKKLFTRPRLLRLRRAGLMPAPTLVNGVPCYSQDTLAAEVMGVGERCSRQTVMQMEKVGLVRRHTLQVLPGFGC